MVVAIKCVDVQRLSEHRVVTRHARRVSRGQTPPVGGAYGAVTVVIIFTRTDRDNHVTESNCNTTQSDGNLTQCRREMINLQCWSLFAESYQGLVRRLRVDVFPEATSIV